MAASKKADKKTISKSKAVGKAITHPPSNGPRHNGRYVADTSSIRKSHSEPTEETSQAYHQLFRALEDQVAEYRRDERPSQYRVHKSYTRRHHRHHHSSESNSDSEKGDGPTKSSGVSKARTRSHRVAELGRDPPQTWYKQTELSEGAARCLWWGLDAKSQKVYPTVAKSYSIYCLMHGIQPPFPATVQSLASWIGSWLSDFGSNFATIKAGLNRVRSLNVALGYDDRAFDHPQLEIVIAGYCRLRGVP